MISEICKKIRDQYNVRFAIKNLINICKKVYTQECFDKAEQELNDLKKELKVFVDEYFNDKYNVDDGTQIYYLLKRLCEGELFITECFTREDFFNVLIGAINRGMRFEEKEHDFLFSYLARYSEVDKMNIKVGDIIMNDDTLYKILKISQCYFTVKIFPSVQSPEFGIMAYIAKEPKEIKRKKIDSIFGRCYLYEAGLTYKSCIDSLEEYLFLNV